MNPRQNLSELSLWAARQMLVPTTPRDLLRYRRARRYVPERARTLRKRLAVMAIESRGH